MSIRRVLVIAAVLGLIVSSPALAVTLSWGPLDTKPTSGTAEIAAGFLLGDQHDDLAVVDATGALFLERTAGGTLFQSGTVALGAVANDVAVGRIGADPGQNDIAVALATGPETVKTAQVQGNGNPVVDQTLTPPSGAKAVAIGDANADGSGDIFVFGANEVRLFLNDGNDAFPNPSTLVVSAAACTASHALDVADFDQDGLADVAFACAEGINERLRILHNDDGGVFSGRLNAGSGNAAALAADLEFTDVTDDGLTDVVNSNAFGPDLHYQTPGGSFGDVFVTISSGTGALATADLDHDGRLDIATLRTVSGVRSVVPYLNRDGSFLEAAPQPVAATAVDLEAFTIDGDTAPELLVVRSGGIDALRSLPVVTTSSGQLGDVVVGQSGPTLPILVVNEGAGRLDLDTGTTAGTNANNFTVVDSGCENRALETGESCLITVRFSPSAAGLRSAAITVTANIASIVIPLAGTGVSATTGPTGPQGIQGPQGPQGPQGGAGQTGAAGPTGPQGTGGAAGPQGPAGATGPAGPQGLPGANGTPGADGQQGAKGDQGAPGADGRAGRDAVVTCKAPKKLKRGAKKIKISCSLKLTPATRVSLRRHGRVIARARATRSGRVRFRSRPLEAGRYTLRAGKARVAVRIS